MKKYLLLSLLLALFFFCFNCKRKIMSTNTKGPESYPYDPVKAGAEIVGSYDLTDLLDPYLNSYKINHRIQFTIYNNNFFFVKKFKIFVLCYDTLREIKELNVNLKSIYHYHFSEHHTITEDIAVFKNKILLSYCLQNKSFKNIFLQMDVDGKNIKFVDFKENIRHYYILYNRSTDELFFFGQEDNINKYFKYTYEIDLDKYTLKGTYELRLPVCYFIDIDGTTFWKSRFSDIRYLEKRDINNPEIALNKINTNYLGTKSRAYIMYPLDIFWDDPYLWILLIKDEKLQLLKIKPL